MNRILVIGDIHGGLRALHQILDRANVSLTDTLIFLGDYVDGWSESPQVIDFLIELGQKQKCIFIKGNHDDLLLDWLTGNAKNFNEEMWFNHGGESTVLAYEKTSIENKEKHVEFLKSLDDYYLDANNRLFIHAGFTNLKGVNHEYFRKLFYWDRSLWETALSFDNRIPKNSVLYPKRFTLYKEIYIGHTPVTRLGETVPINKECVWNIDTGAGFNGPLSIIDADKKVYWQSDELPKLYPNEKGRTQ